MFFVLCIGLMVDKSLVWKRRRDSEEMVLKRLKIAEKSNRRYRLKKLFWSLL